MPSKKRPRQVFLGPSDYCKNGHQKRKLQKSLSGEVKLSNMLDKIETTKSYEEIKAMPIDKAREYITALKKRYSVPIIAAHWDSLSTTENFYSAKLYKIFHEHNVPVRTERMAKAHEIRSQLAEAAKAQTTPTSNPTPISTDNQKAFNIFDQRQDQRSESAASVEQEKVQTVAKSLTKEDFDETRMAKNKNNSDNKKKTSFTINLEGEFDGPTLVQKLNGICQLMNGDRKYNVVFVVEEAGE